IFDVLDHRLEHDDADRPLHLVHRDLGADVGAVALEEGGVQAVLEQVDQLGAIELLGIRQLADRGNNFSGVGHKKQVLGCQLSVVGCRSYSAASRASRTAASGSVRSAPPSGWRTTVASSGTARMRARTRPNPSSRTVMVRP